MVSPTSHVNYVAGGLLVPEPLAGEPALELCNTYAGWGEEAGREYLLAYEHFAVWARERGLVGAGDAARLLEESRARPAEAERVLARARGLRAAFHAIAVGEADDDARASVAHEAERAASGARLEWTADGAAWSLPPTLEQPLLAAAAAVAAFLTVAEPVRVGRCPGHGCGWLFADPRGRRRWCSMAVCGNRAKVRRHAERARRGR
jgi:predicted RNA-binding Zn ribbon-like protein